MNQSIALSLDNITCRFVSSDQLSTYTAIENVHIELETGEFVSIVGPTGCGKSTILNVAAGLINPSSGSVKVFGEPLTSINQHAGYMFQSNTLMPWRSAKENIMLGLEYHQFPKQEIHTIAEEWLRKVGLGNFGDRFPHQLSGGMQKRVALAQTLALNPKIILMDEPFSALVFKIATDPYVGTLTYFRVYSGVLKKGSYVLNSNNGEQERISRILGF